MKNNEEINFYDINSNNLDKVIELYIKYFNEVDGDSWTYEITKRRLSQFLNTRDSFSKVIEVDGKMIGLFYGYIEPFYDISVFHLIEILIIKEEQNKGIGQRVMQMIEDLVREHNVSSIYLESLNDEMHTLFYDKCGYKDVKNLVMKVKRLN